MSQSFLDINELLQFKDPEEIIRLYGDNLNQRQWRQLETAREEVAEIDALLRDAGSQFCQSIGEPPAFHLPPDGSQPTAWSRFLALGARLLASMPPMIPVAAVLILSALLIWRPAEQVVPEGPSPFVVRGIHEDVQLEELCRRIYADHLQLAQKLQKQAGCSDDPDAAETLLETAVTEVSLARSYRPGDARALLLLAELHLQLGHPKRAAAYKAQYQKLTDRK